jgi:RluA family pseudouridine synthase
VQYSRWTTVKTISYAKADVPTQQPESRREGVRHIEVDAERAGQRLDNFLMRVRLEAKPAAPRVPSSMIELLQRAVIHEDERLLVLDKPAGVAVHGGSGVSFGIIEALRAARPHEELELAHRLDRDTSGCLLIARKPSALRTLHALLREGQFEKGYLGLVQGPWDLGRKRIDVPLRTDLRVSGERTVRAHASGKQAVSEFKPVQFFGSRATLMEVAIHTGRTHQIRVHAAHAGHRRREIRRRRIQSSHARGRAGPHVPACPQRQLRVAGRGKLQCERALAR